MKRLYKLLSLNSYQYESSYLGAKKIWIISHIWPPSLKASNSKQCAINVIDRSQLSNLNCKTKQSMFSCHQYCRITFAFKCSSELLAESVVLKNSSPVMKKLKYRISGSRMLSDIGLLENKHYFSLYVFLHWKNAWCYSIDRSIRNSFFTQFLEVKNEDFSQFFSLRHYTLVKESTLFFPWQKNQSNPDIFFYTYHTGGEPEGHA